MDINGFEQLMPAKAGDDEGDPEDADGGDEQERVGGAGHVDEADFDAGVGNTDVVVLSELAGGDPLAYAVLEDVEAGEDGFAIEVTAEIDADERDV